MPLYYEDDFDLAATVATPAAPAGATWPAMPPTIPDPSFSFRQGYTPPAVRGGWVDDLNPTESALRVQIRSTESVAAMGGTAYSWGPTINGGEYTLVGRWAGGGFRLGLTDYYAFRVCFRSLADVYSVLQFGYPVIRYGNIGIRCFGGQLGLNQSSGYSDRHTSDSNNEKTVFHKNITPGGGGAVIGRWYEGIVKVTWATGPTGELEVWTRAPEVDLAWQVMHHETGNPTQQWGKGIDGTNTTASGITVETGLPRQVDDKLSLYGPLVNITVDYGRFAIGQSFAEAEAALGNPSSGDPVDTGGPPPVDPVDEPAVPPFIRSNITGGNLGGQFFQGYPWRYIFTDLDGAVVTWAQGLQHERKIAVNLGQSTLIEGAVDSNDFRVNGLWTDDYPRICQSKRKVYAFRREGGDAQVRWHVRAAGTIMTMDDQGDDDSSLSHFTAFDPWKLLEGRPALNDSGSLPSSDGFRTGDGTGLGWLRGAEVILRFLRNTETFDGFVGIDHPGAGGTAFYGTTGASVDPSTPFIDLTIQQAQSVAEVWNAVVSTGGCEIKLNPIYDPTNRPGYTHEISIQRQVGEDKLDCVFGWDTLNRAVKTIDRMHSAVPGDFFNIVQYFAGQGGPPVPASPLVAPGTSVTDFGRYWSLQFYPSLQTAISQAGSVGSTNGAAALYALAQQALELSKQGKRTLTLRLNPELAVKLPLLDYTVGDRINVWSSKRLRVPSSSGINGRQRVESIPIDISDDDEETVAALLTSPDYRSYAPVETSLLSSFAQPPSNTVLANARMQPAVIAPVTYVPPIENQIRTPSAPGATIDAALARPTTQQPQVMPPTVINP